MSKTEKRALLGQVSVFRVLVQARSFQDLKLKTATLSLTSVYFLLLTDVNQSKGLSHHRYVTHKEKAVLEKFSAPSLVCLIWLVHCNNFLVFPTI